MASPEAVLLSLQVAAFPTSSLGLSLCTPGPAPSSHEAPGLPDEGPGHMTLCDPQPLLQSPVPQTQSHWDLLGVIQKPLDFGGTVQPITAVAGATGLDGEEAVPPKEERPRAGQAGPALSCSVLREFLEIPLARRGRWNQISCHQRFVIVSSLVFGLGRWVNSEEHDRERVPESS